MKKIYSGIVTAFAAAAVTAGVMIYTPSDALEVKLDAPNSVSVGKICVLDVSDTGANSYAWTISPASEALVFENGQKLAFTHYQPGEYLFIIAAAKDGQVGIKEHIVRVTNDTPPDGLARDIKKWVSQVQSPTKEKDIKELSRSFASVASIVSAGAMTEPEEIIKGTIQMNKDALGSNADAWDPFFMGLQSELNSRAKAGKLSTAEDHVKLWFEIASLLDELVNNARSPAS